MSGASLQRIASRAGLSTPLRLDVALALCLLVIAEVELWLLADTGGHSRPVSSVALLVLAAAVVIRRVRPVLAVAACFTTAVVQEALHGAVTKDMTTALLFPAVVMYSAGAVPREREAIGALLLALGLMVGDALVGGSFSGFTFEAMLVTLPWAFGQVIGERSRRAAAFRRLARELELERAARAQRAVQRERARIASELHDVIAHSVSVMTIQIAGARNTLTRDPKRATAMVLAVEETGREALADIRRVLGVLRADGDLRALAPAPGIGQLDELLEACRPHARLRVEGRPVPVLPGIDLAAYRIVEATLAGRADDWGAGPVEVTVRWQDALLELEIVHPDGPGPAGGLGVDPLVGVRERVALYGGALNIDVPANGARLVRATLPLEGAPA